LSLRIASLQPSITLTLAALGRLDVVCAHTKYCVEAMPELAKRGLPVLQDSWSFDKAGNIEALLATKPDAVVASVPYRMESLAAILKAGIPVIAFAPRLMTDIYSDIRILAALVGASGEGEAVVGDMQRALDECRAKNANLREEEKPLVYCEEWGKPLIRSQGWVAELVEAAGGRFSGTPGEHTTVEEVAAADPDVLLFAWCGAGNRVPLERVIAQRGWEQLKSVREGRVFVIPDEYLNTPAPSLLKGLACIAAACWPGRFAEQAAMISLRKAGR